MSQHHQHQLYEGYSGRNPVPTVQGFKAQHAQQQKEVDPALVAESDADVHKPLPVAPSTAPTELADQKFDPSQKSSQSSQSSPDAPTTTTTTTVPPQSSDDVPPSDSAPKKQGESKAEVMEKATANKNKPTDNLKKNKAEHTVVDPVTKQEVIIKDAQYSSYDNDALDPEHAKKGPAQSEPQQDGKSSILHTAPKPAAPTNIFFQPFPPHISTSSLQPITSALSNLWMTLCAGLGIVWLFTAFGHGYWSFLWKSGIIGSLGVASWALVGMTQRKMDKELERVRADLHATRAEQFSPPTPESVEWLNALLKTVWGLINPDMFVSIADMVEDVMQASLPSFVDAVKLSDLGQGTNAVRIVSMRGLPDRPGDKEYPREEWIDQGRPPALSPEEQAKKQKEGKEGGGLDDQSGDYVNYEVALSYQAPPNASSSSLRTSNIHLMIEFFLGLYDWIHIPVPIYAVVEGFAVTARMRLQLVSEPPFVRNVTVTLMGVPKVEVSVVPLAKSLPNVLDLPFISGFVQSAIAAAANEYVAPKSLTLNLAQLIVGDGVKKDTSAVGVLFVRVRHAVGLGAQDSGGKSDPYVVLAYTKLGKPLYSSRIVMGDLNPVFEETAFLLVTPDEIQSEEDLSLQLWDSDKRSADDLVGRVVVSLKELMKHPNEMVDRTDKLTGFEDADSMPGEIFWSVGYFEKYPLNKKLQVSASEAGKTQDVDVEDKASLEPQPTMADSTEEADALTTPPDTSRPSGVLSVIIHQINNLERQDLKGASGDREGAAGQDTDAPNEQQGNLPSAYCEILLNDGMIYKTRTKQYTSMPFFEAGTEKFVRDWTKTVVRVVVRDAKLREHDPILGIVNLPLADVLSKGSAVTGMYSLQEGVGFGRANISVLFKSFKTDLPKTLSGWDTGTLHVISDVNISVDEGSSSKLDGDKLVLRTTESSAQVPTKLSRTEGSEGKMSCTIGDDIRLPFYNRYQSAVQFEIGGGSMFSSGPAAFASLWLQDVVDDEEQKIRIPLLQSKNPSQLKQNYINEQTAKTHEFERIGWLECTVMLDSGLDMDHETAFGNNEAMRHNFETWEHIEGQAQQAEINSHAADDGVIDKDEQKAIDRAKKRELESRHRGKQQFAPVRTAKWMKDGVKSRASNLKSKVTGNKERAPTIETEA